MVKKNAGPKGKKERKPKTPRKLWNLYTIEGDKIVRKNKFSPKSAGDFMANHKGRVVCGKTGYTEFSQKE